MITRLRKYRFIARSAGQILTSREDENMAIKFGELSAEEAEEVAKELAELKAERVDIRLQITDLKDQLAEVEYSIHKLRIQTGI